MAFTQPDQLPYLVVFSIASLFLLIRSHVFDEQSEWIRRRIGDPASISSVYLRGGTIFIVVAVVASAILTQTAASAPLAGAFDGVQDGLLSVSRSIQRYLPTGGSSRPVGLSFGSSTPGRARSGTPTRTWRSRSSANPTDKDRYYWRAVAYDQIDAKGWRVSATASTDRATDAPLFDGLADNVDPATRNSFNFTVTPDGLPRTDDRLADDTPASVDTATKLQTIGDRAVRAPRARWRDRAIHGLRAGADPRERPRRAQRVGAPAGIDDLPRRHPAALLPSRRLTACSGPNARKLEAKILSMAGSDNPYDIATAASQGAPVDRLPLQHATSRPPLRGSQHGRVLRHVQEGVLPVLRRDDGGDPARPGHPDPDRRGFPAGHDGRHRTRPRRSSSARPTPGSRSTSRATAG